jgi:hypothetical protein
LPVVRVRVSAKAAVRANIGGRDGGFRRKYNAVGSEVGQERIIEWDDARLGCQRAKSDDGALDTSTTDGNNIKTYFGCQE